METKKLTSREDLEALRSKLQKEAKKIKRRVAVCSGPGCHVHGSGEVAQAFVDEVAAQGLGSEVRVRATGCHGFCEAGPLAVILPERYCYTKITAEDVPEIVSKTLKKGEVVERLLYLDEKTGQRVLRDEDIPYYKYQHRMLLGQHLDIDPRNIEDYIAAGGYSALAKALFDMGPDKVLNEVKAANLRGRGGGGFPAGVKWETTRNAPGEPKYVIVNADEGDPGAYMDRGLLEGNPHSVLEGLIIGAIAIGSNQGFVYVRQEYPIAVKNIRRAIDQAKKLGLLGENILGSDFSFYVKIHMGAGAFVSGESSALMTAIEGKVGEPRPKYIRTAVKGVWDKPSNLNNVETWANVPLIINNGAKWFSKIGTKKSKGTKIFSLVGKVKNTGLVEVPMGVPLKRIIFDIGGGIRGDKKFKAVQTGGPSGGVIPESLLSIQVDYDELNRVGSMMGSGGMIVMDEDTCMVDVARYYVKFLSDESCGKCVPCREGLRQAVRILERICAGQGEEGDIELLEELGSFMKDASLCALGQTAPNPVMSTLKYFRGEYEAHIYEKRCPAKVCKDLISYFIDPDKCKACGKCFDVCPVDAISGDKRIVHIIDQEKCIKCGSCFAVCPTKFSAVIKLSGEPVPEVAPGTKIKKKAKGEKKCKK